MRKRQVKVFNVNINALAQREVLLLIDNFLLGNEQHQIATVNPEFLMEARKNNYFKRILNSTSLNVPDGIGLVWLAGISSGRIAGIDLMKDICKLASKNNKSCFLFGGRGVVEATKENLVEEFPDLKIAGIAEDREGAKNNIKETDPDIIFVALGAPEQEVWIYENKEKFPQTKLFMGVGGAFDIISGRIKRAPISMQKMGLEWLWRLMQEPKRFRRILKAVFVFPCLILVAKSRNIF